jgi:hypothetical protein
MSMWGPVHDPSDPVPGMEVSTRSRRLAHRGRHGMSHRSDEIPGVFVDRLSLSLVERRAAAGEPAFVQMLARQGGEGRAERRRRWLDDNMDALRAALE